MKGENVRSRVSEWEIIQDIKEVAEDVDGRLRTKDYKETGEYSLQTVRNKFGSWDNALENTFVGETDKTTNEGLFKKWKEELEGKHGRYNLEELTELVQTQPETLNKEIGNFVEWASDQEDFHITKNSGAGGNISTRYFLASGFEQKMNEYLDQVPEEARERVRDLIGQGKNPNAVIGAALYKADEDITQREAAKKADTTSVSLRNYQYEFEDVFDEEEKEETEDYEPFEDERETQVIEPDEKEKLILEYTGGVSNKRKKLMRKIAKELNFYYDGDDYFSYEQLKHIARELGEQSPETATSKQILRYIIAKRVEAHTEEGNLRDKFELYQLAKILDTVANR